MDGDLTNMKKQFGGYKKLSIEYSGSRILLSEGMRLVSDDFSLDAAGEAVSGHAVIELDSDTLSVSDAITALSKKIELKDISVSGSSIDEVVVELYKQYEI